MKARCAWRRGHSGKLAGAYVCTLDLDLSLRVYAFRLLPSLGTALDKCCIVEYLMVDHPKGSSPRLATSLTLKICCD